MKKLYFTVTGTDHRHGQDFVEPKMTVLLEKEPDNEYDTEAIKVSMEGIGQIGYVANSPYTVVGESYSAGRLYDKIGDKAEGTVLYVLPKGLLCYLTVKSPKDEDR
ncbi:MAG: HIRAN domain-containing protein [Clostridia bacterium]|nr:HIRAN domain-containing protein [Clostridia bacterium]